MEGSRISEKYEVFEAIGHGGMANVYRARDNDLERDVAIKEISVQLSENERFIHLFLSEARRMASISHPNVLPIFAIDDDGREGPRLVMELAEGSLAEELGEEPLDPLQVKRIARQLLEGLEAIHGVGLVHRDIKPGNILYCRGFYKISDFGIASDGEAITQVLATPKYMAPELMTRPHLVGPTTDLYSLGLVLYEALVGSARLAQEVTRVVAEEIGQDFNPAPNQTPWQSFHGLPRELPPPHFLRPEIPEEFSHWISRMIRKEVSQRFETCREALTTLDSSAGMHSPASYGVERTQPVATVKTDKPWNLLRVAVVTLLLLMVLVTGLLLWRHRNVAEVEILSHPPGAEIYFEKQRIGLTPRTQRMRVGVSVELRREGFEPLTLTLENRTQSTLLGQLSWTPITILSDPPGARVFWQEKDLGATPLEVQGNGEAIELDLRLEGHEPAFLSLAPGDSPPPLVLRPELPEIPGVEATASAYALHQALRKFVTKETPTHLGLAGGRGSRVRLGEPLRFEVSSPESTHAALFLIFSTGDGALLYPSPKAGSLWLESTQTMPLPLERHAVSGYRLQVSEPLGTDIAYLLTSSDLFPAPPPGKAFGPWMVAYPFATQDPSSPALQLVRWAAEQRRRSPKNTRLVELEIQVVSP